CEDQDRRNVHGAAHGRGSQMLRLDANRIIIVTHRAAHRLRRDEQVCRARRVNTNAPAPDEFLKV
ncbi:MAG: hypothetical protein RIC52_17265, partial [Amphiplicatus sp.]